MKSALAIVSTPLHLIYLCEFNHKYDVDRTEIIILLKRETDRAQLERVLSEVSHVKAHWVILTKKIQNKFIALFEALSLNRLSLSERFYDYGIFADYGRTILANIDCAAYYWLGDGTKLLYEVSPSGVESFNRYKKQKLAEPLTRLLLGKRLVLREDSTIFTPFELNVTLFERHSFDWLRSKYDFTPERADLAVVYFFGSYFSERAGKPLMPDNLYLEYMQRIAAFFAERDLSVEYVPHRHESAQKLQHINQIPGCSVQHFDYPAELEFFKRGKFPAHVASFFSTCLFHFSALGVCQSVTSFYADFGRSNPAYGQVADSIYSALERELGSASIVNLITELESEV